MPPFARVPRKKPVMLAYQDVSTFASARLWELGGIQKNSLRETFMRTAKARKKTREAKARAAKARAKARAKALIQIQPQYVADKVASRIIDVPVPTLRRWRHEERGPKYSKLNGLVRYSIEDLRAYAQANAVTPINDGKPRPPRIKKQSQPAPAAKDGPVAA